MGVITQAQTCKTPRFQPLFKSAYDARRRRLLFKGVGIKLRMLNRDLTPFSFDGIIPPFLPTITPLFFFFLRGRLRNLSRRNVLASARDIQGILGKKLCFLKDFLILYHFEAFKDKMPLLSFRRKLNSLQFLFHNIFLNFAMLPSYGGLNFRK